MQIIKKRCIYDSISVYIIKVTFLYIKDPAKVIRLLI